MRENVVSSEEIAKSNCFQKDGSTSILVDADWNPGLTLRPIITIEGILATSAFKFVFGFYIIYTLSS